ncbi:hypothetical protein M422DRAFT_240337 [Sphaerobolus stellatus SS14]|nr:hypothetical protein M422DRAFT_240337 [Sphaerobolus stellatus SS14]
MAYPPSSSSTNAHYQPLPHDDPEHQDGDGQFEGVQTPRYLDDAPAYEEDDVDIDLEANETSSLVPRLQPAPHSRHQRQPSVKGLFGNLGFNLFNPSSSANEPSPAFRTSLQVTPLASRATTPISSDGVFTNIPAKPISSRDVNKDDEMGEDEWIFMTPEQRKKLPPPKYSRIKRDRAPKYSPTYNAPVIPVPRARSKPPGPRPVYPRINNYPSGPPSHFIFTCLFATLIPFIGYSFAYMASRGYMRRRWKTHAARLGSKAGFGLGLLHFAMMVLYIPQAVTASLDLHVHNKFLLIPVATCILFTLLIFLPIGWPFFRSSLKSYLWLRTQERVLKQRLLSTGMANIAVDDAESTDDGEAMERDDGRDGYLFIEGTDLRVKDLKRVLARARDARLARSLRAAGF